MWLHAAAPTGSGWRRAVADRQLYTPQPGNRLASTKENARVRALVRQAIEDAVAHGAGGADVAAYGRARWRYANDWYDLAGRLGLHRPGEDQKKVYGLTPEAAHALHVDSAATQVRQFTARVRPKQLYAWQLNGLEAVYCQRYGRPMPDFEVQQQLDVAPAPGPATRAERTAARNRELVQLYSAGGWDKERLAARFHLAPATVKKILLEAEGRLRVPPRAQR